MSIYSISSPLINELAYVDLINDDSSKIKFFFLYNEGDLEKKPIFHAQNGFNHTNINRTDIYDCTPGLFIFSQIFYDEMHELLSQEMDFYEADLIVNNQPLICFVGKIKKIQDILNTEKTQYDDWFDDDEPFIEKPVFVKDLENIEYCVKNNTEHQLIIFTEKFKNVVEEKSLRILFNEEQQA